MAEEEEVEEMMDRPLSGKGKGVVREAVGSPEVATCGWARRCIKSAAFVVASDEDDEEVPAAKPVPRATPAALPSKGQKVEVVLPAPRVTIGQVKGTTVSPFAEQFLPGSATVPAILTMDDEAEEEWSGNNEMDVDELEGTPGRRLRMICRWRCEVLGRSPSSTGRGWWQMPSPAKVEKWRPKEKAKGETKRMGLREVCKLMEQMM
jgi:hypothetical protein